MADIEIQHAHGTDAADAATRTKKLLDDFHAKRPELFKDVSWSGQKADVKGKGFKGQFLVDDRLVKVEISLGLVAKALKGRIKGSIEEKLNKEFPS
ncbi:MAG: polyhydroxyalkanoic acid system family protein [Myxococcota bacterium]